MALKGVIQGAGGAAGAAAAGSGVTSVGLVGPAPFITGPPVTSAGNLSFDFSGTPIPVSAGGTGMGSFAANSILQAGPSSTAPHTSIPLTNLTSNFLRGDGVFAVPTGGGGGGGAGTVTSVDLSLSSEFRVSGNPITGAGTLVAGFIQPLNVAHGGTGMGSFAASSILQAGLTSTGPFQSVALNNLTSNFLRGDGVFAAPPPPPAGGTGTVTSVDMTTPPEFVVSGNPVTTAGTLALARISPSSVSAGGTGAGAFTSNALIQAGLSSTGAFRSLPLNQQTSTYLDGTGTFRIIPYPPAAGTGTVTSVDIAVPPGFTVSGNPITVSGTMVIGVISPSSVSAGGTGAGAFTSNALIQAGLSSTGAFRSLPLNQQTSTFLDGTGTFRVPVNPGGTVQSVALAMTSEFSIQGTPIAGSGTFTIGFTQPLAVAHGGTGLGSAGIGAILRGGLSSTAPFQGLPLTNLTSNYLRGDGVFATIPDNPGTVTSVDLSLSSEFRISGNPITGAGTLVAGFIQPVNIAHGGTGLGSFGIGAIVRGGLTSTAPLQGTPLTNLTSTFLDGTGNFSTPPSGGGAGAGTVTSVGLQLTSEFNITGSPVTAAGTLMASFRFQSANFIFGGPGTGASATPAFRALVNADIPQSMSGKTLSSSTFQNPTISTQTLTFASSIQWNMNSGAIALLGMDSTVKGTMDTPANVANTGAAILRVMQLGTGLTNLAWNAFWKFEAVAGARTAPTLSSGYKNIDVLSLYMESTAGYGVARKNFL